MYREFNDFWDKKWWKLSSIENNTLFALKVPDYCDWTNLRLLDLWCGVWRDSLYFAEKGFVVDAFDFSKNALDWLKKFSQEKWLHIKTLLWNILDYNFAEDYYNIIYSCNSLHYFNEADMQNIIQNLKKSLKKWWYIFLRVKSVNDSNYWRWEKIWNFFYKNGDDIKYYFDIGSLKEMFSDFEIVEINELQDVHNKISWEVTINWFIDVVARKL